MNPLVSIVIPHWSLPGNPQGREALAKCLDSVARQSLLPLEVIVVNNEGKGAWAEKLSQDYPDVRWIHNDENILFTGAMNQGIAISRGEFILSLNNDVVLSPFFVQRLVEMMQGRDRIGMACGLLLSANGERVDSAGQILSLARSPHERDHGRPFRQQFDAGVREIFSVPAAAALYRRAMLVDIALSRGEYFDEDFGLFYEDLELAWRAQKKGWRGIFIPTALAYHVRGLTTKAFSPRWKWLRRFHAASLGRPQLFRLIRNRAETLRRHNTLWDWFFCFPWIGSYDVGLRVLWMISK